MNRRIILASLYALACAGFRMSAQGVVPPRDSAALPPQRTASLPGLPKWSASASVEGSYGFKDNLLLSSSAEERSAFARGAVEALFLRVPTGPVDYSLFAQAEGTRYFSGRTVDNEAKAWLQTELGLRAGGDLKLSLPLTGYYYDQVFDVSDTEVERLVAELKVVGMMAGPTVRWTFSPGFWIEGQAVAERKRYEDRVNDCRVGEGSVRLGWSLSEWVETRISGSRRWRDFDARAQYSAAGRELSGTHLKVEETEGELRLNLKWDRNARWQSVTRAGLRNYHDNGSGYFNYREQRIDHEVEWNADPWQIRLSGAARRVDFEVQTVGLGISPPSRLKDEYELELRVERKVTSRWTVFGGYTWERSRANDRVTSYAVNEGLLGVRWNWEE